MWEIGRTNEEVQMESGLQASGPGHPGERVQAPGYHPRVVGSEEL